MNRLIALLLGAALVAAGSAAVAQTSPTDQILTILQRRGYVIVTQERTWLGRGRVVAEKDGMHREVVFNPGTGEILRDYVSAPIIPVKRIGIEDPSKDPDTKPADPPMISGAGRGAIIDMEEALDGLAPGTGAMLK